MQDVDPTGGYSAVLLMILSPSILPHHSDINKTNSSPNPTYPSDTSPHLQQKQQNQASSSAWQTRSKARPGTRNMAAAACRNSQSLQTTDMRVNPSEHITNHNHNHNHIHIPELWLAAKTSKEMCFCSAQRPRDASNGTSLGSRTPCGNGWRSCAATTLVCMQVIHNLKSPLDGLSSGCILLSRSKNFAGQRHSARGSAAQIPVVEAAQSQG
jgi:hypothetical protein